MAGFIMVGLLAVVFLGMGMPLAKRRIPRNRSYGFMTSKYALADDEIWFPVNELGGRQMINTGFVLIIIAVLLLVLKNNILFVKILLLASLAVSMAGVVYTWAKCKNLTNKLVEAKGYRK